MTGKGDGEMGLLARFCLTRGAAAALLVAGLAVSPMRADDGDLDWQSADGSFPDHGGCTYFGPQAGVDPYLTAAHDFAAMRRRSSETKKLLAMIPQPRRGGVFNAAADSGQGTATACTGIDDCIKKTADSAGVPLTYLTTDQEFLRRVTLDLTGRIPTHDQVAGFLADESLGKRAALVERLLDSDPWVDRWTMFFGDLFRNTAQTVQVNRYDTGRDSLHLYLKESLAANKPYDQMARELLAAEGTSDGRVYPDRFRDFQHFQSTYGNYNGNPVRASAVGYVVGGRTTGGPIQDTYDALAFFVARDFLGISAMDCVLCHDGAGHLDALSVWGARATRLEGWSLAAFFSDIPRFQSWRHPGNQLPMNPETNRRVNANFYTVRDLAIGRRQRARNGDTAGEYLGQTAGGNRPDRLYAEQFVAPEYPFASTAVVNSGDRLRVQLGHYLTADLQFARAIVNYVWREFFSRGIVEPPDQFDLARMDPASPPPDGWSIQPSHPRLLEILAQEFQGSGYDLKALMRTIVNSDTYQLSSRYEGVFNPLHERYFVRHQAKRLSAEQVHDALVTASGRLRGYNVSRTFRGTAYAMQFPDVVNMPRGGASGGVRVRQLLQSFTPGDRQETPRSTAGSPLQALNLMNNQFVMDQIRVSQQPGTIMEALELADDAMVARLFLSVLSRHPTTDETARAVRYIEGGDRNNRAADLMWALFNKTDFYFNY